MELDYEAVFLASPAPKMILDEDLKFVAANPAYLKMVGKTEEDILGVYVFEAFPESEDRIGSMTSIFEAGLRGEEAPITEIPFRITVDGVAKEQYWTARHARTTDAAGRPYVIQFSENVTSQVKMREMRNALLGELQHRVGNIFAVVSAAARGVAANATDVASFMERLEDRLETLVKVIRHPTGGVEGEEGLASIIEFQLSAHAPDAMDRISVSGPDFELSAIQAPAISMAVHELATNSVKYGALGHGEGHLSVTWSNLPNGGILFVWKETGVRIAEAETGKGGYGSLLLDTIIPGQVEGRAARAFGASSFTYSLEMGETQPD